MRFGFKRRELIRRIYAIGDLHGRLDLFGRMIAIIRRDHAARLPAPTRIILLGNLIDRGTHSAKLARWCKALSEQTDRFVVLKGEHEAMMVAALRGEPGAMERWLEHGARPTLSSWGVPKADIDRGAGPELSEAALRAVGGEMLDWLAGLPLTDRHEEYLFVHAGIRPGIDLKDQTPEDLLGIGREFLDSKADHGAVVVHGHSTHDSGPQILPNRIGIDSGAFRTGRLSAIGVEDGQVWPLMTERARIPERQATGA